MSSYRRSQRLRKCVVAVAIEFLVHISIIFITCPCVLLPPLHVPFVCYVTLRIIIATYTRSFQPSLCYIFHSHHSFFNYPPTVKLSMCYYFNPVFYITSLFVLGMAQKRPTPAALGLHVPAYTLTCVACNYAAQ